MDYYQLWVQSVTIKHFLAHYSPLYLAMSWLVQSLVAIKQSLHRINSWALNCGHCLWYPSIPFCSIRLSGLFWLTLSQIESRSKEYDKMYAFYSIMFKHIHYLIIKPERRSVLLHVSRKNRFTHKVNPLATSSVSWISRKHLDVHLKKSSPAPNISVTSCTEPSSDHLYQARYKALPIK